MKPSWITSIPPRVGNSNRQGKLKADQWQVLGTLYAPLTLVRLWSESYMGSQRRELLEMTMDLVSAVILATSRQISEENIRAYEDHMKSYRSRLHQLFPQYAVVTNQHFALHLPKFMRLYGPAHGWWTFHFERTIGTLQKINTNYIEGE
jgi:hypothetical protein